MQGPGRSPARPAGRRYHEIVSAAGESDEVGSAGASANGDAPTEDAGAPLDTSTPRWLVWGGAFVVVGIALFALLRLRRPDAA